MSLSQELLTHAEELLRSRPGDVISVVRCRRSISASYYALFHRLGEDAVALIAPNVSSEVRHRVHRWFDHGEMKRICGRFSKRELDQPLLGLIGRSVSDDLQEVASTFISLQEDRHKADYDLEYSADYVLAAERVSSARLAFEAWDRIRASSEANIFMLSLLMWKNWEKERP